MSRTTYLAHVLISVSRCDFLGKAEIENMQPTDGTGLKRRTTEKH